jgi:hypothetical protein
MARTLINAAAVKQYALDASTSDRGGKFTRVSKTFLNDVEANVQRMVRRLVQAHPSKGKTLQGYETVGASHEGD